MNRRQSSFRGLSVRGKLVRRWLRRSLAGRLWQKIVYAWKRLRRWWSIYSLRFSWARFVGGVSSLTCVLGLASLNFWLVSRFLFVSVQVQGSSMYPTLLNSNVYWLDKFAYVIRDPKPGDIVAIKDPTDEGFDVKRIIAVPDQSIYISHGKVYINNKLYWEPYLPQKEPTFAYEKSEDEFFCLAPDQYFVMGDNRGNSCDSRSFGPIRRDAILGRLVQ
jgi:signal peptidase I